MIGRPRASSLLLAAALALGPGVLAQAPAAAGAGGACPGKTGVTVVVDYQALGGGIVVACAPGSPATGFKALTGAGFAITEVQNVPGFLCRIDGKPTKAQDPCINTPPGTAFWSYWHAPRGGDWVLSTEGGKTRKPPAGSVEGWSFSDDGRPGGKAPPPGVAPPAPPVTPKPKTPKPATPRPATPRPATPQPATARPTAKPATARPTAKPVAPTPTDRLGSPGLAGSPEPSPSPTPSASPTAAEESPTGSAAAVVAGATDEPDPSTEPDPVATSSTGGPPPGTLVGIALVAVIGGAALLAATRRSRADHPGG